MTENEFELTKDVEPSQRFCEMQETRYAHILTLDNFEACIELLGDVDLNEYIINTYPSVIAYTRYDETKVIVQLSSVDKPLEFGHVFRHKGIAYVGGKVVYPSEEELGRTVLRGDAQVITRGGLKVPFDIYDTIVNLQEE